MFLSGMSYIATLMSRFTTKQVCLWIWYLGRMLNVSHISILIMFSRSRHLYTYKNYFASNSRIELYSILNLYLWVP